jgi:hypothetical protein
MVCSGGAGGGGGDGDGERGRATLVDFGLVGAAAFGAGFTEVEGPAEGGIELSVEAETGGRDGGSRSAAPAGAGEVDDLGDKFSVISLTSDISKSSEMWSDMPSDMSWAT